MKTNKSLPNGWIDDNNVAHTTKIEGYTTSMSYMNKLGEMVKKYGLKALKGGLVKYDNNRRRILEKS